MKIYRKGNKVILFSAKGSKEGDGVCTVIKKVKPGSKYDCPHCGDFLSLKDNYPSGTFGYYLDFPCPTSCCLPFSPDVLRPSPKPSTLSFEKMLDKMRKGNPHF